MVWPLVTAAVGLLQGNKKDRDQRRQMMDDQRYQRERLYQSLLEGRARELGADTREIGVHQSLQDIDRRSPPPRQPFDNVNIGQVLGMVGGALDGPEDVSKRVAKEGARRGYMFGYEPY